MRTWAASARQQWEARTSAMRAVTVLLVAIDVAGIVCSSFGNDLGIALVGLSVVACGPFGV